MFLGVFFDHGLSQSSNCMVHMKRCPTVGGQGDGPEFPQFNEFHVWQQRVSPAIFPMWQCTGQIHPSLCLVLITGDLTPADGGFQASRWVWLRGSIGRRLKNGEKGEAGVVPCSFLPHRVSGQLLHLLPPFILASHHLRSWRVAFYNLPKSGASLPLCKSTSSLTDRRRTITEIRMLRLHHTSLCSYYFSAPAHGIHLFLSQPFQ